MMRNTLRVLGVQEFTSKGLLSMSEGARSLLGRGFGVEVMAAPNSDQRRACWGARDLLWKCLDDNQEDATACEKFRQDFEANCPAQWVKYFVKRRDFLKYKEKIETEGYESSGQLPKL
ncbi:hypothetical protein GJAV_G00161300 [Gymnothorax javanicus]|nr:hypothetical protein GJAV_G00161300 [Gymnothorax javanicus]